MKKRLSIFGFTLVLLGLGYVFYSTSFPFFPDKSRCIGDDKLLTSTHWKQMGGFEKFTPDKLRLGCWSTALAQITYFHKLKPFGKVSYTSRQGYIINELIDSSQFDLNLFTNDINSTSSDLVKNQMAKYNYYAALAVMKDFGTDRYMNKLASADLLEKHFAFDVERYISWKNFGPYTNGKLEKIIYREINAARPVFLHFANLNDFGHSLVIDGYCYKNNSFFVHTNQGQGGETDGWYDFHKGILRVDDNALRVVYTFKTKIQTEIN